LATKIDSDAGNREGAIAYQKLAIRAFVLEAVDIEASAAVPPDVNARKVALRGAD
jgi:hypothetical protein